MAQLKEYRMWLLAFITSSFLAAAAQVDRKAIQCLEGFVSRYETSGGYKTLMKKTEFEFGKELTENIEITERKGDYLQLKFVDPGKSGIRNNGMTVTYLGGREVKIEFGRSKGLGLVMNALAEVFTIKTRDLYDSDVTEKQIFTVNRAGFGYLANVLHKNLKKLKQGELGDVMSISEKCGVRFSRTKEVESISFSKSSNIQEIEDRFGTLAYLIYKDNVKKFKSFDRFLNFKKTTQIEVAKNFSDFEIQLDDHHSPTHFELIHNGKTIGSYDFKNTDYF